VRLAGHTYAFRNLPLDAALDRLAAIGFTDVELWLGHESGGPGRAGATVARSGLRVRAVSAGGVYRSGDDAAVRAARLAQAVAAPLVVTCVAPELLAEVVEGVPGDVIVALENHWDQPLDTSTHVLAALAGARAPKLRACLDTGHALMAGEEPGNAVAALGDRLAHVHLKEAALPTRVQRLLGKRLRKRLQGRPGPVFPGDGALRIRELRERLEASGFRGWVSLEHEGADADRALAVLRRAWSAF
jgi:sugar phosphate isomerase/epimerase